jgi:DNA replication and repair protein RecF
LSYINNISLLQFKNHSKLKLGFSRKVTALVGKNGSGKTNVLDAIYYICFARSYFAKSDKILCHVAQSGFRVDALLAKNNTEENIVCIYREDATKELLVNGEKITKVSAYLGSNSCVMIAPDDIHIINDGSEYRRKWIDAILCQTNKQYLLHLQQYQKIVTQRNALLKNMAENKQQNSEILDFYNVTMHQHGSYIFHYRNEVLPTLITTIHEYYKAIAGKTDNISINYVSQLQQADLKQLLVMNFSKDYYSQRTNYGIHKDDIEFGMNDELLKQMASQGQKKSFLLAMKLTELNYLTKNLRNKPILLLDDIFERLDDERITRLFAVLNKMDILQIILTDTMAERVEKTLTAVESDFEAISLDKGT